jgi:hypothetical protein
MKAREAIKWLYQQAKEFTEGFSVRVAECFRDIGESPKHSLVVLIVWTVISFIAGAFFF